MKQNIRFLLITILIMIPIVSMRIGVTHDLAAKAQSELLLLAATNPEQSVNVIVQNSGQSEQTEAQVVKLGGKVTQNLSIINAFVAEISAGDAVKLSRMETVRWISLDAQVVSSACSQCIDTANLANSYISTIRADKAWNNAPYLQGKDVGIAILDSGINPSGDLYTNTGVNRQVANVYFNTDYNQNTSDGYGHGTHISSVAAGDGSDSNGKYIGVAPLANVINVKVTNDDGSARSSDVILGLQWILENKAAYNIRVVNISFNSTVNESYHTSPLDAAVEILWFNKIVVVVSAGNQTNGIIYPPANDPFVITVGATDDKGTASLSDDVMASFSAYGTTSDGFIKPDIVAPGRNIVARLVNTNMGMAQAHPANVITQTYFRMSGTSVSAPMVSGGVAILLQADPNLTPDQIKYRLTATANKSWTNYNAKKAGSGYLDVYKAVTTRTVASANTKTLPSQLLTTGPECISWGSTGWNSVGWNTVGWNSVGWNTVGWNTVGWNTVGWNTDYWE